MDVLTYPHLRTPGRPHLRIQARSTYKLQSRKLDQTLPLQACDVNPQTDKRTPMLTSTSEHQSQSNAVALSYAYIGVYFF